MSNELPEIYLDVEKFPTSAICGCLLQPAFCELYLAGAHSGDPAEI